MYIMSLNIHKIKPLEFDWDEANKNKSWKKHRVDFRESEQVFFNKPLKFFSDDKHSQKEERFTAFGMTNKGRKLTLILTIRESRLRIISARDMSKKERKVYEKA
ncbi:BrnT family toxin [Candidatus Gottesmanbacteria bacterium]|nr:BrnT family toxin [Candidatus Gottesmanbacteria bacterium]